MIKNIAVFGATGLIGLPVVKALLRKGFNVSVLSNSILEDELLLPKDVNLVEGNWMYHQDLKRFLSKQDAVYCGLSVDLNEKPEDSHAESDGLREIINASLETGIKRIALLSSMLQYNQVENEDLWWVFKVKKDAVNFVRDSGIPFTVFYPSTFMENFKGNFLSKSHLRIYGQSNFPIYFISAIDYANIVAQSFESNVAQDREYFVQGKNCYKLEEAAKLLIRYNPDRNLKLKSHSMFLLSVLALFQTKYKFFFELFKALNDNNESFIAEETWKVFGEPEISFSEFSKNYFKDISV